MRVLNVDCQSSFENIVVQVIGELSNKGQPHERFVQTFVLATQPNGYFVLNDIFRYFDVDEQDPEIVDDDAKEADVVAEDPAPKTDSVPESAAEEAQTVETEAVADKVDEKLEAVKDESIAAESDINGAENENESAAESAAESAEPEHTAEAEEPAAPVEEEPKDPEPTPAVTPPKSTPSADAAPAKKTWASLVGTKASSTVPVVPSTGAAAAAAAPTQPKVQRPASQAPAVKTPTEASTDAATNATSAGSQTNGWQTAESSKKARGQQPKGAEGIVHAYIRNVNDKIDARELREVLESFGSLKYFDVSRPKVSQARSVARTEANSLQQCAFIEFQDGAGYAAAVSANPHTISGESIVVEERRLRSGQSGPFNNQFGRGGGSGGGGAAGSGRGRGGAPRESSRGSFSGRGNKNGSAPSRGRGQTPAA